MPHRFLRYGAYYLHAPQRYGDAANVFLAQRAGGHAPILFLCVAALFAKQICAVGGGFKQGFQSGLSQVGTVDEGEQLTPVAGSEAEAFLQALKHQEVVVVAGSVDAGGAEDDIRNSAHNHFHLGLQLRRAVTGVGNGRTLFGEGGISFLVAFAKHRHELIYRNLSGTLSTAFRASKKERRYW